MTSIHQHQGTLRQPRSAKFAACRQHLALLPMIATFTKTARSPTKISRRWRTSAKMSLVRLSEQLAGVLQHAKHATTSTPSLRRPSATSRS
jgi:hypothetical protein